MEQAYGQSLAWYFSDWYYGEGYPSYQISWSQDGSNQLSLTVNQTQSHSSVPFFQLPIPIQFKNQTADTIVVFQHDFSGQSFTANLSFQADSIIFDPQRWIISKDNELSGINEMAEVGSIKNYPNPTADAINISFPELGVKAIVQLTDVYGRLIISEEIFSTGSVFSLSVDYLEEGVYFLVISTSKEKTATKVVIAK
jgi:hypothetical protein